MTNALDLNAFENSEDSEETNAFCLSTGRRRFLQGASIALGTIAIPSANAKPNSNIALARRGSCHKTLPTLNAAPIADIRRFHQGPLGSIYKNAPDRMRYIFRHMTEFMTHSTMSRGDGKVRPMPSAAQRGFGATMIEPKLGRMSLDAWVAHPESHIDGMIIVRDGQVLFERYPRMDAADLHIIWSVTKVVVGHCIALLVDDGKVDVTRPMGDYVAELHGTAWGPISVRDVLDQASGIDAQENHPDAFTDPAQPYYSFEASIGYLPERRSSKSTFEIVAAFGAKVKPGTAYEYTSVNAFALAWLVEEVSGLSLARFTAERIWSRIGAEREAVWTISPEGAPGADGGISCTLRDLARYGLNYLPHTNGWDCSATISAAQRNRLRTTGRRDVFLASGYVQPSDQDVPLFNCWHWDDVWPDGDMHKGGWGGQGIYVSPDASIVMAWFGTPPDDKHSNDVDKQARMIAKALKAF